MKFKIFSEEAAIMYKMLLKYQLILTVSNYFKSRNKVHSYKNQIYKNDSFLNGEDWLSKDYISFIYDLRKDYKEKIAAQLQ